MNLSDGGHFDNLGLYEMVLRRCRFIFVSDAGCDPESSFGDLGNAIRKIRIDFGVPIQFERKIQIFPARPRASASTARSRRYDTRSTARPAKATAASSTSSPRSTAAATSRTRTTSTATASRSTQFPHEPTADQWFSESQFESYRALGFHSLEQILRGTPPQDFADFFARATSYMNPGRKRREFKPEREACCRASHCAR